jgi:hypothetical protein
MEAAAGCRHDSRAGWRRYQMKADYVSSGVVWILH